MKIDSQLLFSMNLDNVLQMLDWIRFLSDEECDLLIHYLKMKKKDLKHAQNGMFDIGEMVHNAKENQKFIEIDNEDSETGLKIKDMD